MGGLRIQNVTTAARIQYYIDNVIPSAEWISESIEQSSCYIWALEEARDALTAERNADNTPLDTLWMLCEKYSTWSSRSKAKHDTFLTAAAAVFDAIEWLLTEF